MQQDHQGQGAMTFTIDDWASLTKTIPQELQNVSRLLQESIRASREEAESIRQSIRASDARCEGAIKAANLRIDESRELILKQGATQTKWGAFGAGIASVVVALWAILKFFFNRG